MWLQRQGMRCEVFSIVLFPDAGVSGAKGRGMVTGKRIAEVSHFCSPSQAERARVRVDVAGADRNAGLVHMVPMDVGCAIPKTLADLPYVMVVVELGDRVCFLSRSTCVALTVAKCG